jgi:hypothetical protein
LLREENLKTWRKTLEIRERINNKLNSHVMPSPGIEPKTTVVRGGVSVVHWHIAAHSGKATNQGFSRIRMTH